MRVFPLVLVGLENILVLKLSSLLGFEPILLRFVAALVAFVDVTAGPPACSGGINGYWLLLLLLPSADLPACSGVNKRHFILVVAVVVINSGECLPFWLFWCFCHRTFEECLTFGRCCWPGGRIEDSS